MNKMKVEKYKDVEVYIMGEEIELQISPCDNTSISHYMTIPEAINLINDLTQKVYILEKKKDDFLSDKEDVTDDE